MSAFIENSGSVVQDISSGLQEDVSDMASSVRAPDVFGRACVSSTIIRN